MSKVRFNPYAYLTESEIPENAPAGFYLVQEGRKIIHIKSNGQRIAYASGDDIHNMGNYLSAAELQTAHPSASSGDYATVIVDNAPRRYVWSTAAVAWVDSGISGAYVETVNEKAGPDVTLSAADVGAPSAEVFGELVEAVDGKQEDLGEFINAALENARSPGADNRFLVEADFGEYVLAALAAAINPGPDNPFLTGSLATAGEIALRDGAGILSASNILRLFNIASTVITSDYDVSNIFVDPDLPRHKGFVSVRYSPTDSRWLTPQAAQTPLYVLKGDTNAQLYHVLTLGNWSSAGNSWGTQIAHLIATNQLFIRAKTFEGATSAWRTVSLV